MSIDRMPEDEPWVVLAEAARRLGMSKPTLNDRVLTEPARTFLEETGRHRRFVYWPDVQDWTIRRSPSSSGPACGGSLKRLDEVLVAVVRGHCAPHGTQERLATERAHRTGEVDIITRERFRQFVDEDR
jgi:hypothetical protein